MGYELVITNVPKPRRQDDILGASPQKVAVRLQTGPEEIRIRLRLAQENCMDILINTASVLMELYSGSLWKP